MASARLNLSLEKERRKRKREQRKGKRNGKKEERKERHEPERIAGQPSTEDGIGQRGAANVVQRMKSENCLSHNGFHAGVVAVLQIVLERSLKMKQSVPEVDHG